jgi:hypothetical protein
MVNTTKTACLGMEKFKVPSSRFKVPSSRFKVPVFGFREKLPNPESRQGGIALTPKPE